MVLLKAFYALSLMIISPAPELANTEPLQFEMDLETLLRPLILITQYKLN